jgi:hypothetical protein
MLVQDILLAGGSAATIQAMLALFKQNGNFLEPIDVLFNPSILDQLFAYELMRGRGNVVYDTVALFFVSLTTLDEPPQPVSPRRFGEIDAAMTVTPRSHWAKAAAAVLAQGGKASALYQVLATMFVTR